MSTVFNKKALVLYGAVQVAEGVSVVNAAPSGTITTTAGSKVVAGTGTSFTTQVAPGSYIYTTTGQIVGRVDAIASNTSLTVEDNVPASAVVASAGIQAVATAVTGVAFETGLGPKNALAVINSNFSKELTSEAFEYSGDELSRDEVTVITDTFGKLDFETLLPSLGTIVGTDPTIKEVPMLPWFNSSNFAAVLSTGSQGYVKLTNSLPSNAFLTIEVRLSSPDLVLQQKTYTLTDCRGSLDTDTEIGKKFKLKFNYQGNIQRIADVFSLVPDYALQKTNLMGNLKDTNITTTQLGLYSAGVAPSYVATTKNVCFSKIAIPNVAGFDYVRKQTSCVAGWGKEAKPTDVTLTIIEDKAGATYNPYDHLEENHSLFIDFGTVVGKKARWVFKKLLLAKVTQADVGSDRGQDLGFRNIDTVDLYLL